MNIRYAERCTVLGCLDLCISALIRRIAVGVQYLAINDQFSAHKVLTKLERIYVGAVCDVVVC